MVKKFYNMVCYNKDTRKYHTPCQVIEAGSMNTACVEYAKKFELFCKMKNHGIYEAWTRDVDNLIIYHLKEKNLNVQKFNEENFK